MSKAEKTTALADKKPLVVLAVAAIVALTVLAACVSSSTPSAPSTCEQATLEWVVDGDTIIVNIGGESKKVRLIGIDCPESASDDESENTPEGLQATEFARSVLELGQDIWLMRDASETDRYGRLLRYVWLQPPTEAPSLDEVRENMLNGIVVANGYAIAKRYPPDTTFAEYFEKLAEEARTAGLGVSDKLVE